MRGRARVNLRKTWLISNGVTKLWVVLHGATAQGVHAEVHGELPVTEPSEVRYQVALRHGSQLHRLCREVLHWQVGTHGLHVDIGSAQLIRTATLDGHFKEGGLGITAHQGR